MMRLFLRSRLGILFWLAILGPLVARGDDPRPPEVVASSGPRDPKDERSSFRLPPGFEIQLVAADPDIHKPLNLAFDDRGRLWVTETLEYPFPAGAGTRPRDSVKILSDFGPDGRARSITTFADGLNIPIGLIPFPGGREALIHSIPSVDHFADRDGDGKADLREVAYATIGSRDTHGMTNAFSWGFDGSIFACHGFNNDSDLKGKDGRVVALQSGNTYRMRADGSHVEQFTHGMVNPFGLCFDPLGNLFASDCHSKPVYMLLRGAYYPSFGKPDDGLGFAPEMVTHDHGSTAISGCVIYSAAHFPAEYRNNVLLGNVVTNRINRDTITWNGSTPTGVLQPDFLTSDDPWFRPVDLELGPDGALYVADFYNKIIGHYEVPLDHPGRDRERGRIWRIVYRGEDGQITPPPMPNIAAMSISELTSMLSDPNLVVQTLATNQIVSRGGAEAIAALGSAPMTVASLWGLQRLGALDEPLLLAATTNQDRSIRTHAQKIIAERHSIGDPLKKAARSGLTDGDAFVRRASTDALGTHPDPGNVRPLVAARQAAPVEDRALIHTIRMVLRDQFTAGKAAWPDSADASFPESDLRTLADVAVGDPSPGSARFLIGFVAKYPESPPTLTSHLHHIARHGDETTLASLNRFLVDHDRDPILDRSALLKPILAGIEERGKPIDGLLSEQAGQIIAKLLDDSRPPAKLQGIELASTLRREDHRETIRTIALDASQADDVRLAAVPASLTLDPEAAIEPIGRILNDPTTPPPIREAAIQALARSNRPPALTRLVAALPVVPGAVQTTIAAALATSHSGAESLMAAVEAGKASPRLLQERAVRVFLDQSGILDLAARIEPLMRGLQPADARMVELLDRRRASFPRSPRDSARGKLVFQQNCIACHQIGGEGAKVGPQLDGIGARGADRLMEDVLDPNRNIDQAFRLTTLALADGRTVSGLKMSDQGDLVILADNQGKEIRVVKSSIEASTVAPVSPMPADFADRIPEADFLDLMAYLAGNRPAK